MCPSSAPYLGPALIHAPALDQLVVTLHLSLRFAQGQSAHQASVKQTMAQSEVSAASLKIAKRKPKGGGSGGGGGASLDGGLDGGGTVGSGAGGTVGSGGGGGGGGGSPAGPAAAPGKRPVLDKNHLTVSQRAWLVALQGRRWGCVKVPPPFVVCNK